MVPFEAWVIPFEAWVVTFEAWVAWVGVYVCSFMLLFTALCGYGTSCDILVEHFRIPIILRKPKVGTERYASVRFSQKVFWELESLV